MGWEAPPEDLHGPFVPLAHHGHHLPRGLPRPGMHALLRASLQQLLGQPRGVDLGLVVVPPVLVLPAGRSLGGPRGGGARSPRRGGPVLRARLAAAAAAAAPTRSRRPIRGHCSRVPPRQSRKGLARPHLLLTAPLATARSLPTTSPSSASSGASRREATAHATRRKRPAERTHPSLRGPLQLGSNGPAQPREGSIRNGRRHRQPQVVQQAAPVQRPLLHLSRLVRWQLHQQPAEHAAGRHSQGCARPVPGPLPQETLPLKHGLQDGLCVLEWGGALVRDGDRQEQAQEGLCTVGRGSGVHKLETFKHGCKAAINRGQKARASSAEIECQQAQGRHGKVRQCVRQAAYPSALKNDSFIIFSLAT